MFALGNLIITLEDIELFWAKIEYFRIFLMFELNLKGI